MPRRRSSAAPERVAAADLHFGSLDVGEDEVERLAVLLDPAERARAARFAFARDRRRFIVRRARLRAVLAEATGVAAERLVYTENAHGKPALAGGPKFSASHSHELWAVAVSDRELGVDLEYHQPGIEWRDLAAGLFGAGECAALDALAEDDVVRGFFDCWARKEAFVKAIGMGLSYPLDAFAVSVTPEARLLAGADGWRIAKVALAEGYSGALVVADDGAPIEIVTRPSSTSVRPERSRRVCHQRGALGHVLRQAQHERGGLRSYPGSRVNEIYLPLHPFAPSDVEGHAIRMVSRLRSTRTVGGWTLTPPLRPAADNRHILARPCRRGGRSGATRS